MRTKPIVLAQRVGHLARIAEIHAKHGNTSAAADCLADAWHLLAPHGAHLRRAADRRLSRAA